MSDFFSLVKFVFAGLIGLGVIFLILIALPKSRLRGVALTISGWVMKLLALLCLVYVVSPLDLIPDAIPVAGLADDLLALIIGTASAIGGFSSAKAGRRQDGDIIEASYTVLPDENREEC